MKRLSTFVIILSFITIVSANSEPVRAVWVPCEGEYRALESPEKIEHLVETCKKLRISVIYLQIYRGNRAWYSSDYADDAPYERIKEATGTDPVKALVKKAHDKGIEVHAWCNIFRIAKNTDGQLLKEIGDNAVTADNKGRSILSYKGFRIPSPDGDYYSYGNDGIWLEAGNLKVQEYQLKILDEILQKYPEFDGIHLDFVRYPFCTPVKLGSRFYYGIDYGYGKESINRFTESGGHDPLAGGVNREATITWDTWRRSQITDFISKAHEVCGKKGKILSSAVIAWPDIAYNAAFQDWMGWLAEDIIDVVIPMLYTTDQRALKYASTAAIHFKGSNRVYIGIGAYLFTESLEKEFALVWNELLESGPDGIAIFSFDSLIKNSSQLRFLAENNKSDNKDME